MKSFIIILGILLIALGTLSATCDNIIYVNADAIGTNDGSSWQDAYIEFQPALDEAQSCLGTQEIWIAGGTYRPTVDVVGGTTSGTQNLVFNVDFDVKIYGGFCGWESVRYERIKYLCPTILSGDHDQDDILITDMNDVGFPFSNGDDNSYNIMRMKNLTTATVLDDLTFMGGNADHPSTLSKKIGGAIFNDGRGINNTSNPQINNCVFMHNKSRLGGGAIYNYGVGGDASPSISGCDFRYNKSYQDGGAIFNHGANTNGISSPIIRSCLFERNRAEELGGGIHCAADEDGMSLPSLSQSTFVYNSARLGGGFYLLEATGTTGTLDLDGCIFFFNDGGEDPTKPSFASMNYLISPHYSLFPEASVIQVNFNTNSNPEFVNDTSNFRLKPNSPCIDNGAIIPILRLPVFSRDIDDNSRSMGATYDMGAYEFLTCPSGNEIFVDASSTNFRNGELSGTALSSLNMALNMACNCDSTPVINIADGRYVPHRLSDLTVAEDRTTHSFQVDCPMVIQGGDETVLSGDAFYNDINGLIVGISITDNADNVLDVNSKSVSIDNVIVRSAGLAGLLVSGTVSDRNIQVTNSRFYKNLTEAFQVLSAGDNSKDTIIIKGSTFEKNFGIFNSDGCINIETRGRTIVQIMDCEFSENRIGGIYLRLKDSSQSIIDRCTFRENLSYIGAGIEISNYANSSDSSSFHTISNCAFWDNTSLSSGAAIYGRRSADTNYDISNCTFFRNFADHLESGVLNFFQNQGSAIIKNCIFWDNTNQQGLKGISGDLDISYSLIESDDCPTIDSPNIRCGEVMYYNVDPQFQSLGGTLGADLNLLSSSPAINRGDRVIYDPIVTFGPQLFDINGNNRFRSNRIDLGAYEYQPASGTDCPLSVTNPVAAPDTMLDISLLAKDSIELSQDYKTLASGALFLDSRNINIHPTLEIDSGAVMEVYVGGCSP